MSGPALKVFFIVLTFLWLAVSFFSVFVTALGDCGDNIPCLETQDAQLSMIGWRCLAGCLILFNIYMFFRKDSDVQ